MESKYLAEITEHSLSYRTKDSAEAAAMRLHNRIRSGNTLVIVRVSNPRYNAQ